MHLHRIFSWMGILGFFWTFAQWRPFSLVNGRVWLDAITFAHYTIWGHVFSQAGISASIAATVCLFAFFLMMFVQSIFQKYHTSAPNMLTALLFSAIVHFTASLAVFALCFTSSYKWALFGSYLYHFMILFLFGTLAWLGKQTKLFPNAMVWAAWGIVGLEALFLINPSFSSSLVFLSPAKGLWCLAGAIWYARQRNQTATTTAAEPLTISNPTSSSDAPKTAEKIAFGFFSLSALAVAGLVFMMMQFAGNASGLGAIGVIYMFLIAMGIAGVAFLLGLSAYLYDLFRYKEGITPWRKRNNRLVGALLLSAAIIALILPHYR